MATAIGTHLFDFVKVEGSAMSLYLSLINHLFLKEFDLEFIEKLPYWNVVLVHFLYLSLLIDPSHY
jgi:hypothetical protein